MKFELMNEAIKHDIADIAKVAGVNGSVFGFVSWAGALPILQAIALIIGIGYTCFKLYRAMVEHSWDRRDRRRRMNEKTPRDD